MTDTRFGIGSSHSFNNTFSENTMTNCQQGIYIWDGAYTTASRNTVTNTTAHSVSAKFSSYCVFYENTLTNSAMRGVCFGNSSDCVASKNTVKFTANQGIHSFYSSGITVSENTLTSNYVGVGFYMSSGSTVFENTISNCKRGITVVQANNNKFYHNSLIDNQYQVISENSMTKWDEGYPSGGNYWSDYTGTDTNGDGLGDTPYIIDVSNQDHYPLMVPNGSRISISYTLEVDSVPSGVTFTANNVTCVAPWSETSNQTTLVTLTMPESYSYEDKTYNWSQWSDENPNRTRTVTMNTNLTLTGIFTTENEPATITLLSPENRTYIVADVPLEFSLNGTVTGIKYELDGQENVSIVGNITLVDLTNGQHRIILFGEDRLGNEVMSDIVYFTVDV